MDPCFKGHGARYPEECGKIDVEFPPTALLELCASIGGCTDLDGLGDLPPPGQVGPAGHHMKVLQ